MPKFAVTDVFHPRYFSSVTAKVNAKIFTAQSLLLPENPIQNRSTAFSQSIDKLSTLVLKLSFEILNTLYLMSSDTLMRKHLDFH